MSDDPWISFGFDGEKPRPADPIAALFVDKIVEVLNARERFNKAVENVPAYTGQWSAEDYYATAEEGYNRAADELWDFVKLNVKK